MAREQHAILERAGLALVGVADHVAREARGVPAGLPLDAGGEARAAAAAQVRALDLLERRDRALRRADVRLAPGALVGRVLGPALRAALQRGANRVAGLRARGRAGCRRGARCPAPRRTRPATRRAACGRGSGRRCARRARRSSAGMARPFTSSAGPWSHMPVHEVRAMLTSPSSDTLPGSAHSRWHIASSRRSLPAMRSVMLSENSTR